MVIRADRCRDGVQALVPADRHPARRVHREEQDAFFARPQVAELAATPYEVLLDAGIDAARHGVLPLERWLNAVHTVRPIGA